MMNNRKEIVVVDDNASNLAACEYILRPFYEVYTVSSPMKLFDLLKIIL